MEDSQEYSPPVGLDAFETQFGRARDAVCALHWNESRHASAPWDGLHYVLHGASRPISVSLGEARLLAFSVQSIDARVVLEIGTGFGYSTAWLGFGASLVKASVISIDDHSEGALGAAGRDAARALTTTAGVGSQVTFVSGSSPSDVSAAIDGRTVDLAFIDGGHNGEQPTQDFEAVLDHLSDSGVVIFHDAFYFGPERRNTVHRAVDHAITQGFSLVSLNSSCQPAVLSRSKTNLSKVVAAFHAVRKLQGIAHSDGAVREVSE